MGKGRSYVNIGGLRQEHGREGTDPGRRPEDKCGDKGRSWVVRLVGNGERIRVSSREGKN